MNAPLIPALILLASAGALPGPRLDTSPLASGYFETVSRDEYILGPGDVLTVVVEGGCNDFMLMSGLLPSAVCPVSGDGRIQMPGVGQVAVDGLSIQEAQQALETLARRYYPGLRLGLTLKEPRLLSVWISGMVESPGSYSLYSISRVSDLVKAAGGIAPFGSRIGEMHLEDGSVFEVDLSFAGSGRPRFDPYLVNGASVVIRPVSRPVFVLRPGEVLLSSEGNLLENARNHVEAWDFVPGETVTGFLQRTGGPDGRVDIPGTSLVSRGVETPVWDPEGGFADRILSPGDTLRLAVLGNHVHVAGAVNTPGVVLYQGGMTVRECIDMAGGPAPRGRTGQTVLTRDGRVIARGREALNRSALPGDVIEVPYSVESRYETTILILASLVTMTATIINLTRD